MANRDPLTDGQILAFDPPDESPNFPEVGRISLDQLPEEIRVLRDIGHNSRAQLVYVNGMNTTPRTHREVAEALAWLTNRRVVGIYNQTGSSSAENQTEHGLQDFAQSVVDYTNTVGRARALAPFRSAVSSSFTGSPAEVLARTTVALYRYATADFDQHCELLLEELRSNLAAVSLFQYLRTRFQRQQRKVIIVPHSQGNLITSNVIWCLMRAYGSANLPSYVKVTGIASPSPTWPTSGRRNFAWHTFNDRRDFVTWLGNIPEMAAGAAIGTLTGAGGTVTGAAEGFEYARRSGGSRDIRNTAAGSRPSLDAHHALRYLAHRDVIAQLTNDLR